MGQKVKLVELTRYGSIPGRGTFGRLRVFNDEHEQRFECCTVEREWLDNRPNISCIPEGNYVLQLGMYYGGDGVGGRRDYEAYIVQDVPGRSLIKIHIANYAEQLKGCIAPGMRFGTVSGEWAVASSTDAFDLMMAALMGDRTASLEIGHT